MGKQLPIEITWAYGVGQEESITVDSKDVTIRDMNRQICISRKCLPDLIAALNLANSSEIKPDD